MYLKKLVGRRYVWTSKGFSSRRPWVIPPDPWPQISYMTHLLLRLLIFLHLDNWKYLLLSCFYPFIIVVPLFLTNAPTCAFHKYIFSHIFSFFVYHFPSSSDGFLWFVMSWLVWVPFDENTRGHCLSFVTPLSFSFFFLFFFNLCIRFVFSLMCIVFALAFLLKAVPCL